MSFEPTSPKSEPGSPKTDLNLGPMLLNPDLSHIFTPEIICETLGIDKAQFIWMKLPRKIQLAKYKALFDAFKEKEGVVLFSRNELVDLLSHVVCLVYKSLPLDVRVGEKRKRKEISESSSEDVSSEETSDSDVYEDDSEEL